MESISQKIYGHFDLICPQTLEMQMNVLRPSLLLDAALEQMYILIETEEMKSRGKFKLAFRQMKLAESDIKLLLDASERETLATAGAKNDKQKNSIRKLTLIAKKL